MKITRDTQTEEQFKKYLSTWVNDWSGTRTSGVHLSSVISSIAIRMELLRVQDQNIEESAMRFVIGYAWEDIIGKFLALSQGNPSVGQFECELDGIIGTPDMYDPVDSVISEFKATWMGATDQIEGNDKFWRWLAQIKGYCKMTGSNKAKLYVFFINGDYRPPAPEPRVFNLTIPQDEIDSNWRLIVNHARTMEVH